MSVTFGEDLFSRHLKSDFWPLLQKHLYLLHFLTLFFGNVVVDILVEFVGVDIFTQEPLPTMFACAMCCPIDRDWQMERHVVAKRKRDATHDPHAEAWAKFLENL